MKNKKIFLINLIYFIAIISVAILFALGYMGIFKSDILSSFLIQIIVMLAIPLLLYTLFISKNINKTFKDTGFKPISLNMLGTVLLIGVVLYFLNSFIADFFQSIIAMFGYENIGASATTKLNYEFLLKKFILSTILPAICEEFLHRGIILHAGKKCGNTRYSLLFSSILFGLMHLNINQFFYAAILGGFMGYVNLISDSIYPSIIIHFMNNFLSLYFYYGYYLDWPLATFVGNMETFFLNNIVLFVLASSITVFVLLALFILLTKRLMMQRAKRDVKKLIVELQLTSLPIHEAQEKVDLANQIVEDSKKQKPIPKGIKHSFTDNIFLIASIILGGLITISTFIWGIL